jgi:hypothetical protein
MYLSGVVAVIGVAGGARMGAGISGRNQVVFFALAAMLFFGLGTVTMSVARQMALRSARRWSKPPEKKGTAENL